MGKKCRDVDLWSKGFSGGRAEDEQWSSGSDVDLWSSDGRAEDEQLGDFLICGLAVVEAVG